MTDQFRDKFNRTEIGSNYIVPCGGVIVVDNESVIPVDAAIIDSGLSPIFVPGSTSVKTQVFYNQEAMDGPDQLVRMIFAHDESDETVLPNVSTDPSLSVLARMGKDPLLFDLGVDEDPACFDQGYGARVTMPRDGSAPILKIIKFLPSIRVPNISRPVSTEVDGMVVLASVTLQDVDLNLDQSYDADVDTLLPYRGFWQDIRMRIRRSDNEVILDVYLNDRNLNQPVLSFTDKADPLWGDVGLPGFEFLGATLITQPTGVSPFALAGLSTLRVGQFQVQTVKDLRRPVSVHPSNLMTYLEVANRVITLVEKNGDARYNATIPGATNATIAGTTKFDTYLHFVFEAETDIIKHQGFWTWAKREERIFLIDGQSDYEVPQDCGEIQMIRPAWNQPPFTAMDITHFVQRFGPATNTMGRPIAYAIVGMGPDDRQIFRLFPTPIVPITGLGASPGGGVSVEEEFIIVNYYVRALRPDPDEADVLLPLVPQEHMDVLVYGAAAHALLINTDHQDAARFAMAYAAKLQKMQRADNRGPVLTVARSAADVLNPIQQTRLPLTRTGQLENLL